MYDGLEAEEQKDYEYRAIVLNLEAEEEAICKCWSTDTLDCSFWGLGEREKGGICAEGEKMGGWV